MSFQVKQAALVCVLGGGLSACAPELVSLQPLDAPAPVNTSQTFVDKYGCSWWVIGNATDLSWAPMTNTDGEQVCDEGQTRLDVPDGFSQEAVAADIGDPVPLPAGFDDQPIDVIDQTSIDTPIDTPVARPIAVAPGQMFVQVATFANQANAQASQQVFEGLGFSVSSGSSDADNEGFYRIVLGPFDTQEQADKALSSAYTEGFGDAFVFKN